MKYMCKYLYNVTKLMLFSVINQSKVLSIDFFVSKYDLSNYYKFQI